MEHIVITTDLSEESYAALDIARQQVELRSSKPIKLTMLSVIETPILIGDPSDALVAYGDMEALLVSQEKRAREVLGDLARGYFPKQQVEVVVLRTGMDVAAAIVDYVEDHKVSLLIMASHGRKGFRRFFLGSVTERVLRHSQVPVIVVPIVVP